jgi:hypothetical protein
MEHTLAREWTLFYEFLLVYMYIAYVTVCNTAMPMQCLPALECNGVSSKASLAVAVLLVAETFVGDELVMIELLLLLTRIMISSSLPLLLSMSATAAAAAALLLLLPL